jgi:hypothetical protein
VDLTQKAICMVFHGRHWTDLQLHADSVYFSLEQDAEDWARLQADTALALPSPNLKVCLNSLQYFTFEKQCRHGFAIFVFKCAKTLNCNNQEDTEVSGAAYIVVHCILGKI